MKITDALNNGAGDILEAEQSSWCEFGSKADLAQPEAKL